MIARLRRDTAGSSSLEFAITGMTMVLFTIGAIQFGILYWSWQALQGAAVDAARCAGINGTSCKNAGTTPLNTQNYALSSAQFRGFNALSASNVTVTTGTAAQTACNTTATVVSVVISYNIGSLFPGLIPSNINAASCFPLN